jgi:hypothetical protein
MIVLKAQIKGSTHLVKAPVAVLQLYSAMLNDMAAQGVFAEGEAAPVVTVSSHHTPEGVSAALRWAMGLQTLLTMDVHTCLQVLRYDAAQCFPEASSDDS